MPLEPLSHHVLIWALDMMEPDDELHSIIQLWNAGEQGPAELAWWRSPSPVVRKLVIALLHISYSDKDGPELPRFEVESDRFDAAESEQRTAEIADVLDNLDEIKARLSPWLEPQ